MARRTGLSQKTRIHPIRGCAFVTGMARKRKADQEAGPSRRRGRGLSDQQADAEPQEQIDAAVSAEEDVNVEIEDEDVQGGNQRREEWAALARRCIPCLLSDGTLQCIKPLK